MAETFAETSAVPYAGDLRYEEFKKLSATINKDVEIIKNNQIIKAYAFDISENGELMVKKEDGTTLTVNSGEVSVRGIYGYN